MRHFVGLAVAFAILFSGLSAPIALANGCLAVTDTVVTGIGSCTGDITIPNGVTSIGANAFRGETSLTSITIPASVTSIGANAFQQATSLTSVIFEPESTLLSIGFEAFYEVGNSLTTFTIPNSVTSIGVQAFAYTGITSITIPASVAVIEDSAFIGYSGLESFTVAEANPNFKSIDSVLFNKSGTTLKAYPASKAGSSYVIPDGVTTIGKQAFFGASAPTSITIASTVTSIGSQSFYSTDGLTTITIPAGVTSIDNNAFQSSGIKSITITSSATSIGGDAFLGTSLETVRFLGSEVPTGVSSGLGAPDTTKAVVNDSAIKASFLPLVGGKWNGLSVITVAEFEAEPAAATFDSLIAALPAVGSITTANASAVASARSAYTALTSAAQALVAASLATLVLAEAKIASLTAPTAPSTPSAESLAAIARSEARAAAIAQASARSELAANSSSLLTVEKFASAGISGVTAKNIGAVSAEIKALSVERRGEIGEILTIARKFEVVDIVATSKRINASMLQEIGLIKSDNKNRSAITAALAKLPSSERASFAAIESAIAKVMKTIQKRKDRLAAVQARLKR
jgi:hypothetical protein